MSSHINEEDTAHLVVAEARALATDMNRKIG